jgi:hypothetical protein
VPFKEILVRTEYAAHAIGLDTFSATRNQIVCPELVLDKDGYLRMS